jgi:hypothetical protein
MDFPADELILILLRMKQSSLKTVTSVTGRDHSTLISDSAVVCARQCCAGIGGQQYSAAARQGVDGKRPRAQSQEAGAERRAADELSRRCPGSVPANLYINRDKIKQ